MLQLGEEYIVIAEGRVQLERNSSVGEYLCLSMVTMPRRNGGVKSISKQNFSLSSCVTR